MAHVWTCCGSVRLSSIVVIDPPVLHDLQLLLGWDAGSFHDVGAGKPESERERSLLCGYLAELQMTTSTNSTQRVKSGSEAISKIKSLVEEIGTINKIVTDEEATRKDVC